MLVPAGTVARMAPDGALTEFAARGLGDPADRAAFGSLAAGPDQLWFSESGAGRLGMISCAR